ncbi:MAG: hypothetical protein ACXW2M_09330 [Candidatus Aminicenantales bacterium]
MKRVAVLAFVVMFAACLFHFYYAEDHCPVHCPSRSGGFGHVHPHHAGAAVCLCFWSSLSGPEALDTLSTGALASVLVALPATGRVLAMMAADITPPPRSFLV